MGRPAARISDLTAHGGVITLGAPNVLIGGMPAARMGDMHVCALVTPPFGPPHVGGPIIMGSPTVLIGGMPAARMGDMATCVGPPDVIVMGCFTVLIGEAGGGAPTAGGAGAGVSISGAGAPGNSAGAAVFSAGIAMMEGAGAEPTSQDAHWIEYQFVDSAGNPVGGVHYKFTAPDGTERESMLGSDGRIYWTGPDAGQANVKLMSLSNARWSKNKAEVGETVKMTADVDGYDPGTEATFSVYERNVSGADKLIATIETQTQANKVEAEWQYQYPEEDTDEDAEAADTEDQESEDAQTAEDETRTRMRYSAPDYYFIVKVENEQAKSDFLEIYDYLEVELKNQDDEPVADEEYILYLPNGQIRRGRLDNNGHMREENIPPGYCEIKFPNLPDNL